MGMNQEQYTRNYYFFQKKPTTKNPFLQGLLIPQPPLLDTLLHT